MNKKPKQEIARNIMDIIKRKYSYLLIKQEEFRQARKILETRATEADTELKLLNLGIEALSRFRDGHINIIDEKGRRNTVFWQTPEINYDFSVTSNYLSDSQQSGPIRLGRIREIIYVGLDSLCESEAKHFDFLYKREAPIEKKFIIDLRANGGGSDRLGKPLTSFFLGDRSPVISAYYQYRIDEKDPTRLSDFFPRYIKPTQNSPRKKIAVLIGRETCSSAELTTLDLAAIPGAVLIGDTTMGSSGCPKRYLVEGHEAGKDVGYDEPLSSFFALEVPSWLVYRQDKVLVQDNGIIPNIIIESSNSIKGNKDLVLEKAIEVLS